MGLVWAFNIDPVVPLLDVYQMIGYSTIVYSCYADPKP